MLTTAATPGHAMKTNPAQAFGSVLGKAMGALGVGLLPIHVCLQ